MASARDHGASMMALASTRKRISRSRRRIAQPWSARFQGEAFLRNLDLLGRFEAIAREAGCTPAQLCLAWLLQKDRTLIPIPGTTSPDHMREDMAASGVTLSDGVMAQVEATVNASTVTGPRYAPAMQASVDTERLPGEAVD